jgi:hypothetical protein
VNSTNAVISSYGVHGNMNSFKLDELKSKSITPIKIKVG